MPLLQYFYIFPINVNETQGIYGTTVCIKLEDWILRGEEDGKKSFPVDCVLLNIKKSPFIRTCVWNFISSSCYTYVNNELGFKVGMGGRGDDLKKGAGLKKGIYRSQSKEE
jgi:hypothetical protein